MSPTGETAEVNEAARAAALARSLALSRLVGRLSARAYYLAATRDIPSFRAMTGRESPCLLQVRTGWQECSTNIFIVVFQAVCPCCRIKGAPAVPEND